MQDVIDNCVIPLLPLDFICVDKRSREIALDRIHKLTIPPTDADYYRVIRLLGENDRNERITMFTMRNYDVEGFKIAMRKGLVREDHYKYHRYYTTINHAHGQTLWAASRLNVYGFDMNKIIPYIDPKYTDDEHYKDVIRTDLSYHIFTDGANGNGMFNSDQNHKWNEYYARRLIELAVRYFPEQITYYIHYTLHDFEDNDEDDNNRHNRIYNVSVRWLKLVMEIARDIILDEHMEQLHVKLWRAQMTDVMHELRVEVYDAKAQIKNLLFTKLRLEVCDIRGSYLRGRAAKWHANETPLSAPVRQQWSYKSYLYIIVKVADWSYYANEEVIDDDFENDNIDEDVEDGIENN